jgi:D-alanyl-D-alanine carboxypeptidase/D-alanyl-D-alanine-endopeptidase (penicillin-binding protein 4)
LKEIIAALNHESINLYAEHMVKELGKELRQNGTTASGIEVVKQFLSGAGTNTGGIFIEDGSGLSPLDAIDSRSMTQLLYFMKSESKHFNIFLESLPAVGKEGNLKNNFKDPVFQGRLYAKSGSMTRVRSYAGYLKVSSGKDLIFCIIVNNFEGPSSKIITRIEEILKETILNN